MISPWFDVHSLCIAVAIKLPLQRGLTFQQAPARTSTRDGTPRNGLERDVHDIKGCKQAHIPGIGIDLRLDHGVRHGDIAGGELRLGVLRGALGWGIEQLADSRCIEGGRREHFSRWNAEGTDKVMAGGKASAWWGLESGPWLSSGGCSGRGVARP